jgi:uncharacterized protein CbrC (UPF0167 family)
MPEMLHVRVYGVRRQDGGTCESCQRQRAVVYVQKLDEFLCSLCLAGDQPGIDRQLMEQESGALGEDVVEVDGP